MDEIDAEIENSINDDPVITYLYEELNKHTKNGNTRMCKIINDDIIFLRGCHRKQIIEHHERRKIIRERLKLEHKIYQRRQEEKNKDIEILAKSIADKIIEYLK